MEMALGLLYGAICASLFWLFVIAIGAMPSAQNIQFHHDCKVMAHGTVNGKLCVKGNVILFHQ